MVVVDVDVMASWWWFPEEAARAGCAVEGEVEGRATAPLEGWPFANSPAISQTELQTYINEGPRLLIGLHFQAINWVVA